MTGFAWAAGGAVGMCVHMFCIQTPGSESQAPNALAVRQTLTGPLTALLKLLSNILRVNRQLTQIPQKMAK